MNKIYKVIWSKTRNCYIVVSEFAKTNSKGSGKKMARILAAGTLALGLMGFSMPGDAADTIAYRSLESGGTTTYNNLYVNVSTQNELDTATKKLNAVVNAVDVNAAGETTIHADTAKQLTYNNGSSTISAETLANAANAVGTLKDSTTENGVVKADQTVGQNLNALDDRITNVKNYIQSETAANYVSKAEVSVGEGSDLISNSNTIGQNVQNVDAALHKEIAARIGADAAQDKTISNLNTEIGKTNTVLGQVATAVGAVNNELVNTNTALAATNTNVTALQNTMGTITDSTTENGVVKADQTVGENLNALDDRITNVKNYVQNEMGQNYVSKADAQASDSVLVTKYNADGTVAERGTISSETTVGHNVDVLAAAQEAERNARIKADQQQDKAIQQVNANAAAGIAAVNTAVYNEGLARQFGDNGALKLDDSNTVIKQTVAADGTYSNATATKLNIGTTAEQAEVKVNGNFSAEATEGNKKSSFRQRIDSILSEIQDGTSSNKTTSTATRERTTVTDGTNTTTATQTATNINEAIKETDASGQTVKSLNHRTSVAEDVNKMTDTTANTFSSRSQKAGEIADTVKDTAAGTQTRLSQNGKDISLTAQNGTITNTAEDIHNKASNKITNEALDIENNVSSSIKDTVKNAAGTATTEKIATSTTETFQDAAGGTEGFGATYERGLKQSREQLLKNGYSNTETKNAEGTQNYLKNGDNIAQENKSAKQMEASVTDGTNTSRNVQTAAQKTSSVTDGTNQTVVNQTATELAGSVTDGTKTNAYSNKVGSFAQNIADGSKVNAVAKNVDGTTNLVTDGTNQTSQVQTAKDITNTAANGTITNSAKDLVNTAANNITNTAAETIANNAKNITNTATEKISNSAADIENKATNSIKDSVGDNVSREMTTKKITEDVKSEDGSKVNHESRTASKYLNKVTDGTKASSISQKADQIGFDLKDGDTYQKQTNSIDGGTVFENSANNQAITTAPQSTESGFTKTTIKGNTVTTGSATMDWAEVMNDLGVRGNATVDGNTTLGKEGADTTLTVNSSSTFKENATFEKDVEVKGNTTTNTLKVTSTSEFGGQATFHDVVNMDKDLNVGGNANISGDVTARSYKVGDKTYIDKNGINANNQKITNVAPGEISASSTDAVNGSQLHATNQRIDRLDSRVDKVGANAAAMANLHPLEFDADSKWNIAAAVGNYRSETATAIGAFYRANENTMFNISTSFGNGENMFGAGVSLRLGSGGNKARRLNAGDNQRVQELEKQVNTLTSQMEALLSVLNPAMSKDFPDVPENHWAYDAVSKLAGNGLVQGYEDGQFHGERTMTRYEMAEIIYNALSKGAKAEKKLVDEFKPELQAMAAQRQAKA